MKTITKYTLIIALLGANIFASELKQQDLDTISKSKYGKDFNTLEENEKQDIKKLLQTKLTVLNLAEQSDISNTKEYKEKVQNAQKSILMNMYLEQKRDSMEVSQKELQEYYDAHKRDYTEAHVRTIVRKNKEDIEKYIEILKNTSKQNLEQKFIELAKKHSQHPRKSQGGDMGYISYYTMANPFGEKAFQLKENSITQEPFKTTLGYHIVYLKDKKTTPLKDVQENIKYKLKMDKYKVWFSGLPTTELNLL